MTYTELQTRADSFMHRTDLTTLWPTFIALAESAIFRELDLREMEVSVTGTAVDGFITLPDDFGFMGRLTVTVGGNEVNVEYNNRIDTYVATNPLTYSQENNKLRLFPAATNQAYKLYYTANLAPLTTGTPTNWLSINAGDLYLYATCLEAAKWARDGDLIASLTQTVAPLVDSVRNLSKRKTKPNRGNLKVRLRNILI
jgi:hypothetical protein